MTFKPGQSGNPAGKKPGTAGGNHNPVKKFDPGVSGNPGGKRPGMRVVENAIREAAGKYAPEALEFLFNIVKGTCDGIPFNDIGARVKAATYLVDRAVGKPAQAVHVAGEGGGAIQVSHNIEAFLDKLREIRKRREQTELPPPYVNGHDA